MIGEHKILLLIIVPYSAEELKKSFIQTRSKKKGKWKEDKKGF